MSDATQLLEEEWGAGDWSWLASGGSGRGKGARIFRGGDGEKRCLQEAFSAPRGKSCQVVARAASPFALVLSWKKGGTETSVPCWQITRLCWWRRGDFSAFFFLLLFFLFF